MTGRGEEGSVFDFFFLRIEKRKSERKRRNEFDGNKKKHGGVAKDEDKDEVGGEGVTMRRRGAGGTGRLLQCCATLIYVYS